MVMKPARVIFTVGNRKGYRTHITSQWSKGERAYKIGAASFLPSINGEYGGGIAFYTEFLARRYLAKGGVSATYSVFMLDGQWDDDVELDMGSGIFRVVRDLVIIGEVSG